MKKTTNYQLSQWDAGDRILREDFNQDNKKLDNAIAALRDASPVVKLLDFTARSSQSKMEISLADIDLSDYRELWIYPKFSASTTEGAVRKSISATHIGNTSASPAESHL